MSNTNQGESDPLVELLRHPEVRERLNKGIFAGLSGHTKIDYAIGVVEQAVAGESLRDKKSPGSDSLISGYDQLRSDPKYQAYFTRSERSSTNSARDITPEYIRR